MANYVYTWCIHLFRIAEKDRQLSEVQSELHELKENVELYRRKNNVRMSFVSVFLHQLVLHHFIHLKNGRKIFIYRNKKDIYEITDILYIW